MRTRSLAGRFAQLAMVPLLVAAVGVGFAQRDSDRGHDDHDHGHGQENRGNDRRGQENRGNDFHFRDQDRGRFQSHYSRDVDRWRRRPQGRPFFVRGQRIPSGYRFQPVPRTYYTNVPPPPGYQYGYYDGYVVAYDPTTRIIADVMDLVAAAAR
jgi:Ni/Co efflux regulator RcnB